jgi:uncharacterized LabA/DUF88 family protein
LSRAKPPKKVCVYVDGFNLYHAVAALNDQRLKWLNFNSLAESYLRPNEILVRVYFFTAILKWNPDKQIRHRNFIKAQEAVGVKIVEANFKKVQKHCRAFDRWCKHYEEKQTDVAIATTLLADAINGDVNRAILITADSDQVPLVKTVRRLFPKLRINLSAPPGRADNARELGGVVHERTPLTLGRLHAHRLPRDVKNAKGETVASMPALYLREG